MANLPLSLRFVPLLLTLTGCGLVTIRTGSSTPLRGGSSEAAEATPTENAGAAAESPAVQEKREKARAWFGRCSAAYDDFITTWRPLDVEAKKLIAENRGKTFYEAYPRLAGEYRKLREEARRLHGRDNLPSQYGYARGPAIELLLAIADLQIQTDHVSEIPFNPNRDIFLSSFPMSGDEAFDRAVFCSYATYHGAPARLGGGGPGKLEAFDTNDQRFPAPWMTRQEKLDFKSRVDALLEKTRLALNLIIEKKNQWNERVGNTYGGDYGAVKQVKVQPGGATQIQGAAIETPYTCSHSGTYHWNGVAFTDCDIVDLPSRETYAFTVTFKELPSSGLKPGDKLSFSGLNPKGGYSEKVNGVWEGLVVRTVTRKGKLVHATDLLDKLDDPH